MTRVVPRRESDPASKPSTTTPKMPERRREMGFTIGWFCYTAYRRMGAGAGGILGVGKSKATEVQATDVGVTFKVVGGADEAIAELREIIQFLKTPDQFARLGGRIPKGVLLVWPPGTGKTLIAKATAGEAQVPFFEASGSEFIEMFVGVGAARVHDLFEQARRAAPAIVFINEIDAIGQSRAGAVRVVMTNDEREQTLNQLLAEIDGFKADAARADDHHGGHEPSGDSRIDPVRRPTAAVSRGGPFRRQAS